MTKLEETKMNLNITKILSGTVAAAGLVLLSLNVSAASFTGKLNGHGCAHEGTSCPVDRLDPHVTLEQDFVLITSSGDYYFLPNLSRDTKVRYVLQDVQVMGEKHARYNSIKVSELQVKKGGGWKTIWSPELQRNEWQAQQTRGNQ